MTKVSRTSIADRDRVRWPVGSSFGVALSFDVDVDTWPRSVDREIDLRPGGKFHIVGWSKGLPGAVADIEKKVELDERAKRAAEHRFLTGEFSPDVSPLMGPDTMGGPNVREAEVPHVHVASNGTRHTALGAGHSSQGGGH